MSAPNVAGRSLWRRHLALWLPAALLLALDLAALAIYPVRFAGRAEVTAGELTAAKTELAGLTRRRRDLEAQAAAIGQTRLAVEKLYSERLGTEAQNLTRLIAEVKDLAARSGLTPQAVSYPRESLETYGLRKRSFVFSVQGTYPDLRKLINLLELSDSFLTLEQVSLSSAGAGGTLSIQLRISTLFSTGEDPLAEAS